MKIEVKIPCCPKCMAKTATKHAIVALIAFGAVVGLGVLRLLRWISATEEEA
jgi:hypothetical protein